MASDMSNDAPPDTRRHYDAPPANTGLLIVALVLVLIPVVALMLVGTYATASPSLFGFPFFFWYQFLWVFLCSGFTYAAFVVVRKARPHRPMNAEGDEFLEDETR